jgi:hypothetical protein
MAAVYMVRLFRSFLSDVGTVAVCFQGWIGDNFALFSSAWRSSAIPALGVSLRESALHTTTLLDSVKFGIFTKHLVMK